MEETTLPLFRQVADLVADSIVDGTLGEGERAPSTNELADFHRINPATARKGLGLLVEWGVLEKRRGMGMYVVPGARETIRNYRRNEFAARYVVPLVDEAVKLGIERPALQALVRDVGEARGLYE